MRLAKQQAPHEDIEIGGGTVSTLFKTKVLATHPSLY